ncbi:MAG: hypothetical protein U0T64_01665 [Buchnera aphidicola (Nurudea yanoniella)]
MPFRDNFLLINDIENDTHYHIETDKIQNVILNFFKTDIIFFNIITKQTIEKVKKCFKISVKDVLINRNKALLLAKKSHANYLMYNILYKKNKILYFKSQIILVSSKEIFLDFETLIEILKN